MDAKLDAQAAAERFFNAFYSGDAEATREAVSKDFVMEGPFATAHDIEELLSLSEGLMKIVRGHKVLRWIVDGNNVSALYQIMIAGSAGVGPLTTGGWFTVVDGRLVRGQVIYDSAEFDAIVARR